MSILLGTAQKFFMMLSETYEHILTKIFRITDDGHDRITDDGDPRITDDSDY